MFASCDRINNLDLNSFDVTCVDGIFQECTRLTTLNVQGWPVSDTCKTCDMFTGCTSIKNANFLTKYTPNHVTDDN